MKYHYIVCEHGEKKILKRTPSQDGVARQWIYTYISSALERNKETPRILT